MLFSILKVNKILQNTPSSMIHGESKIETSKRNDYTTFNINWKKGIESKNVKGLYFNYKTETIILLETFSKPARDSSKQLFSELFNSDVSDYHFSLNMRRLLKSFDKITEMRLRTPDPLIEEINIVGEDLEDSETFEYFMESEVVYFTTFNKNFSASMKIFEDGRISIIPEKDYEIVVSFLTNVLEKL